MAFKNLGKLRVDPEKTARLVLPFCMGSCMEPVILHVLPAVGVANKPMQAAILGLPPVPKDLPDDIRADLNVRRTSKLLGQYVVRAWDNVRDDQDQVSPCTPENVEAFLLALRDDAEDLWIQVTGFVQNLDNFRRVVARADVPKG
jgi:hypothetical protein